MEQTDEKKTAEEILDELSGWQGFEGLVMDGNFSCSDIAIEAMKAYAAQQVTLSTTAKQSIIDGQKERIGALTEALRQMRDVYFYKDGERTGHLWEICNTALNQTKP